ncbi:uncharacterized protein LOC122987076 [Scomber scombrus]|uniref:Uncharacterized protein LOC122987076 n=1 Tax=Scomber scombrus TaxID=13677 RepID=A0AAV1Q4L3_SCOSC
MAAGATLLLLLASLGITHCFYGDSISFMPPQKNKDGTYKVTFHHRLNGRNNCKGQSAYKCDSGVCKKFDVGALVQTDRDSTGQGRWCQSEGHTAAVVSTDKTTFSLSESGCCWDSNVLGKTNWTADAQLDLGTRSDTRALNSCPVTTTVSELRVAQNCFSRIRLLAHDTDGDDVTCRLNKDISVNTNFTLDEDSCTLTLKGHVDVGVYVMEVMLEDSPTKSINLTYADGSSKFVDASDANASPLCSIKLQFTLEILPSLPNCEVGHVQPIFLSKTPSQGNVIHATVGKKFQLYAQAQAHHASIHDFQVSGPQNMVKEFKDGKDGKAEVTLSWTPQRQDVYRFVPVCFTAETNESQSEMRCVVVMVTQASIIQGKAHVTCSPNKMVVTLDKASMPGIDENYLKLKDPSCSLTSNSTHIMGSMSFGTCGTKLEDKGDFIAFKNEIISYVLPSEVIIRRRTVKIDFSCQFPKSISISSYYNLQKSDYIFTESSFGSFGYTFEIFTDGNYTSKVAASAYPVEVKLLDTIYMGIQAESELPNVTLFVESCKATPDDNPENLLSYDLIKDGCMLDETVITHQSGLKTFNFEVQAFKFTGEKYDQVYITCSVILCEPGNSFSRCAQGCLKNSPSRRKRSLSRETANHYITQGPLRFIREAVPKAADGNDALKEKTKSDIPQAAVNLPPDSSETKSNGGGLGILNTSVSTLVFASAFMITVVMMGVMVGYFTRKRKAEDRQTLLVSALDD